MAEREPKQVQAWCDTCGPVAVEAAQAEVHSGVDGWPTLFAFRCPGCSELASGTCVQAIARLRAGGAVERRLLPMPAGSIDEVEIAAFRRDLDSGDPWSELPEPG
jgi:hypothetical protein